LKVQNAQKRQSGWQCCLVLLGPTSVKAASKTLVKLTLVVIITNISRAAFARADPKSANKRSSHQSFCTFWEGSE